jgi:hypothetical protein
MCVPQSSSGSSQSALRLSPEEIARTKSEAIVRTSPYRLPSSTIRICGADASRRFFFWLGRLETSLDLVREGVEFTRKSEKRFAFGSVGDRLRVNPDVLCAVPVSQRALCIGFGHRKSLAGAEELARKPQQSPYRDPEGFRELSPKACTKRRWRACRDSLPETCAPSTQMAAFGSQFRRGSAGS